MTGEEILKDAKKYGMNFIDDLNSTLEKESDRGIILICASTIDSVLRDLIEKYLNKNKGRKKEISKLFEYPNPLSSFASKIQMSYCLGLISKDIYEDFERVRKIRNNLAHGYDFKDFSSNEIASIVFKLEGAKKCWEFRRQKNPEKYKEQKSLKKEDVDVEKISKMVFVTTVSFWLGTLAQGYENLPDFMLDKYLNSDE